MNWGVNRIIYKENKPKNYTTMKRILLMFAVALLSSCGGKKVIEFPNVENQSVLTVNKVELTDSVTVLHAVAQSNMAGWFRFDGDEQGECYLSGQDSGNKYMFLGSEEMELGKKYSGVVPMTLRFEPIERKDKMVDVIMDKDEVLNIKGLELNSRECEPYTCHVNAKIEGDTKVVMVCRYENFDGNIRGAVRHSFLVPVVDGGFEIDLPTSGDDFYVIVAMEDYVRSRMWTCEFIASKGEIDITCNFNEKDKKVSGEDNILAESIMQRGRDVVAQFSKPLRNLKEEGFYESDYTKDLEKRAEAEKDREKQMNLYNELNRLTPDKRYCPEYYAVFAQRMEAEKRVTIEILCEAEANPSIGYFDFVDECYKSLKSGDRYNAREQIERVAQLYLEKFPHNNKVKRLAEYIEGSKVKVGNNYIDFEAPDMEGKIFRLSQMIKGSRIVVLDLWASWCGPCRMQAMKNIPIYEKYKDKGMCVVSVARERNNLDDLEKAVAKDGYKWPVLVELNDRINLWRQYNAGDSGGEMYVIDPATKKILAIGPSTEEIEALVEQYCK